MSKTFKIGITGAFLIGGVGQVIWALFFINNDDMFKFHAIFSLIALLFFMGCFIIDLWKKY